jgi:hypothetical protein
MAHASTVEEELENLRERKHSWSWSIPDPVIAESWGEFERWLRKRADPNGKFTDRVTYVIEAWSWA